MNFAQKVKAARAALDWNREDLAKRADMSVSGLSSIELGEADAKESTQAKILRAFEAAGITFTADGISQPRGATVNFQGENWFAELLEDVYYTLLDKPGAELIVDMADDRQSPPEIVRLYRKLRNAGIRMRQTVEEGNTHLMGPVSEYRWVPKEHYMNWVTLIYGDKVANTLADESGCTVIIDKDNAEAARQKFNLVWGLLPEITTESTANERF